MMVNDNIHTVRILLHFRRQHVLRRHIDGNNGLRLKALRRIIRLHQMCVPARHALIFREIRGLAQLAQCLTQRTGAARRVTVRTAMRQNQNVICLLEQLCGAGYRANHSLPSRSSSCSTSLMCAPCVMESSSVNTISGA